MDKHNIEIVIQRSEFAMLQVLLQEDLDLHVVSLSRSELDLTESPDGTSTLLECVVNCSIGLDVVEMETTSTPSKHANKSVKVG